MREGRFREDLYYRLNIIKIDVPPLRERREDIPPLVEYFINKYRSELDISEDFTISPEMMDLFLQYDWPGNVRELANTIQRLMVMGDWDEIRQRMSLGPYTTHLMSGLMHNNQRIESDIEEVVPLKQLKARAGDHIEKRVITHVLRVTGGNKAKAAQALNISYKALFYKMRNLGLR